MNEPWNIPNSPWKDEKAYLNWLRGSIRRIWSRHPVKISYKNQRRYKAPVGKLGKDVWVSDCELCGKQCRDCQVDHLQGGYGFIDWQSFTEWCKMILWVGFEDIRELCPECHEAVTFSQRMGISMEQARIEKLVISLEKKKMLVDYIESKGEKPAKNAKARRAQAIELLIKEKEENDTNSN